MDKLTEEELANLNEEDMLMLFDILGIDVEQLLSEIETTKRSGMTPTSIGVPHPELRVNGIPVEFEERGVDIIVYCEDKSRMN